MRRVFVPQEVHRGDTTWFVKTRKRADGLHRNVKTQVGNRMKQKTKRSQGSWSTSAQCYGIVGMLSKSLSQFVSRPVFESMKRVVNVQNDSLEKAIRKLRLLGAQLDGTKVLSIPYNKATAASKWRNMLDRSMRRLKLLEGILLPQEAAWIQEYSSSLRSQWADKMCEPP